MMSIEERYNRDPIIRQLVDSLEYHISTLKLTGTEIRECAMLAAIHHDQHTPLTEKLIDEYIKRPSI